MALTFTMDGPNTGPKYSGPRQKVWTGSITLDANYATGGWALTPQNFGMFNIIEAVDVQSRHTKYQFSWDKTNQKLKAYLKQIKTGPTGAADSASGALAVDNQGAEIAGVRVMSSSTSTAYDAVSHLEAGVSDANLNTLVLRVRVEGW